MYELPSEATKSTRNHSLCKVSVQTSYEYEYEVPRGKCVEFGDVKAETEGIPSGPVPTRKLLAKAKSSQLRILRLSKLRN